MEFSKDELDRYYGISEAHFDKSVRVRNLKVEWDLYTSSMNPDEVTDVNRLLTEAAIEALQEPDPNIFWKAAKKYSWAGAADTEPTAQFNMLWHLAFGDYQ